MKIDIYKSIFLLILGVFVYCYYLNTLNGRFLHFGEAEIIDTRNGAIYETDYVNSISELKINPIIK